MNNLNKNKKVLFAVLTHGDEEVGLQAVEKIKDYHDLFDWEIANQLAYEKNVRFVDCDLNRCAPGFLGSSKYEENRAAEIISFCEKYSQVIDIHGSTNRECGIFIIITKPTYKNLLLASCFDIKNIVFWVSGEKKENGPWTRFVDQAIEIECGNKDKTETVDELSDILASFLNDKEERFNNGLEKNLIDKKIFSVYGKVDKNDAEILFTDFKEVEFDGEKFFPILSGQYDKIKCYKMKDVSQEVLNDKFLFDS